MPEEKFDSQEQRRRALESAPPQTSDAHVVREENARRFREESARIQAEQAKQEQFQRDRQAAHQEAARRIDSEIRAELLLRMMQTERAREDARLRAEAEAAAAAATLPPPRPSPELLAEQEAGRRALLRHAGRAQEAAAAREKIKVEEKDRAPLVSGFKVE